MIPTWVRTVTVGAVSLVAVVAAVTSYQHMHELAEAAGEGWRAYIIPLSVDGMLVAASMVMLVRRQRRQRAGLLPWVGLVLGLTASLAANIAAARPDLLSWIVSGWPAVALAVSFELLILVARDTSQTPGPRDRIAELDEDDQDASQAMPDDDESVVDTLDERGVSLFWETAPLAAPSEPRRVDELTDEDGRVAALIAGGAGRVQLQRELHITEYAAKQLLREHRNGHKAANNR